MSWGHGAIYFIHAPEVGRIKIGFSTNWQNRFLEFMVGCPTLLDLLVVVDGDHNDEQALHRAFRSAHYRGEWFTASAELLNFCRVLAKLPESSRAALVAAKIAEHREALAASKVRWDAEAERKSLIAAVSTFVEKHGKARTLEVTGAGSQSLRNWLSGERAISARFFNRLNAADPEHFSEFWGFRVERISA